MTLGFGFWVLGVGFEVLGLGFGGRGLGFGVQGSGCRVLSGLHVDVLPGTNWAGRCRANNMAHIRQSRPYSGLGFQVTVLKTV